MASLVKVAWEEQRSNGPDRQIAFKIKNRDLPTVVGDATLIKNVLGNLLSNAVKFTGLRGEATIDFDGYVEGNETVYYVKDNGVGFDPRYAHKLFGVFQRLHSGAAYEGTGVGLAIVKRIIQRHGGQVWAEGQENEGATFYFVLPGNRE